MSVTKIDKHARVMGEHRQKLRAILQDKYEKGASIRQLMEETGRSYGFVHRILSESDVVMRGRGGSTRAPRLPSPASSR